MLNNVYICNHISKSMIERISKVLKIKGLTASKFAEEIGVQRSNISHILSGRNKPSLELVLKILEKYPDINPDWLLRGKGEIFREGTDLFTNFEHEATEDHPQRQKDSMNGRKAANTVHETPAENQSENAPLPESLGGGAGKEEIEKIIIFYRNKKFRVYFPGN